MGVWRRVQASPCFSGLYDFQRAWMTLFHAVAARDVPRMAELAKALLDSQKDAGNEAREYLLEVAMAAEIAAGRREEALKAWQAHGERERKKGDAVFRLLRCHARAQDCAREFAQAAR